MRDRSSGTARELSVGDHRSPAADEGDDRLAAISCYNYRTQLTVAGRLAVEGLEAGQAVTLVLDRNAEEALETLQTLGFALREALSERRLAIFYYRRGVRDRIFFRHDYEAIFEELPAVRPDVPARVIMLELDTLFEAGVEAAIDNQVEELGDVVRRHEASVWGLYTPSDGDALGEALAREGSRGGLWCASPEARSGELRWHVHDASFEKIGEEARRGEATRVGGRAAVTPAVSIVLSVRDGNADVARSRRELLALDYPDAEILLMDDGGEEETRAIAPSAIGEAGGRLRVIRQERAGRRRALGLGARVSRRPFVLWAESGALPDRDGLEAALRRFRDPRVAAVAGAVDWPARGYASVPHGIPLVPGPLALFRRAALVEASAALAPGTPARGDAELTIRLLANDHDLVIEAAFATRVSGTPVSAASARPAPGPSVHTVSAALGRALERLRTSRDSDRDLLRALFVEFGVGSAGSERRVPVPVSRLLLRATLLPALVLATASAGLAGASAHGALGAVLTAALPASALLLLVAAGARDALACRRASRGPSERDGEESPAAEAPAGRAFLKRYVPLERRG